MSLSKMVAEALQYLGSVRNYAPMTLESYEISFGQFRHFLYAKGLPDDVRQFTGDNVFRFAESLAGKKQKASTIVIRLSALSTLAQTLMKLKDARGKAYLLQNPTKTFEWPTIDQPETKFLLPDELTAFLSVARPLRESIARDVLVDTGMRCSELCRANVGDVLVVGGRTALALTVKGRGRRVRKEHIPLSEPVATALFEYLVERGVSNPQDARHRVEPLLLCGPGRRWTRTGLSGLMARIGEAAGISRMRVSAHKLRHTAAIVQRFARRSDGSTLDRWTRSKLLSQRNPQSLDRYEHLLPDELFEAREAQRRGLARYLGEGGQGPDPAPPAL
jgi:site-specific recombinase XerD